MDKFKFYMFKIHLDIDEISNLLTSNNDDYYGIKFIKQTEIYHEFNFYERKLLETTFIDKDLKEHIIEHVKIDEFCFYIYTFGKLKFLVLKNPSRNISFFKNFISKKLFNKASITNIIFDPLLLFYFLKDQKDINIVISSLEVKDIQLSGSTIATITIKSTDNLVNNFKKYIQSDNYVISKALFTSSSRFKGKLLLTHEGALSLQIYQQNDFLDLFISFLNNYVLPKESTNPL
ncbi:hypothetical protein ACW7EJ_00780 [Acinetobacter soli]